MSPPICSVESCGRPAVSKGWCDAHYRRWRKTGSVGTGPIGLPARKSCSVPGCGRPGVARELCNGHYQRWRKTGETPRELLMTDQNAQRCSVEGCERPAKTRGWCNGHYQRWWATREIPTGHIGRQRRQPVPCAVEDCGRFAKIGEYCAPHGKRVQRSGDPGSAEVRSVAGHGSGRCRYLAAGGYVMVKAPADHPNAYRNGRILEHTLVMSELLCRPLYPGENVHHKNGDRADNRPENLELWVIRQPKGQRATDLLAWAQEIIDRYGDVDPKALS